MRLTESVLTGQRRWK